MSDQNSQFENDFDEIAPENTSELDVTEKEEATEAVTEETQEAVAEENTEEVASEKGFEEAPSNEEEPVVSIPDAPYAPPMSYTPPKTRGVPVWMAVLTATLCIACLLGSACIGFLIAHYGADGELGGVATGESTTDGVQGSSTENPTEHLKENPEELLDKSEPNESIYGSAGEEVFTVSGVARKVQDAVVVIEAKVTSTSMFGQPTTQTSSGSGVVISADGYVLTCHHVVDGASSVQVIMNSGESFEASLVGSDAASDLAVLKIAPKEGSFVYVEQGCSEDLVLGEQVVAIGNPLGILGGTVTTGIVSATEREIQMNDGTKMTLIQTDAAINSGNSGGGLFNLDGQLIGIVNSKYSASGVEGLAFAIPIDSAYTVQLDLIEYGYVRGVIDHGLELLEIDGSMLRYYQLHYGIEETGVYVVDSEYSEDLKNADLIRSVNGKEIKTMADFDAMIKEHAVGDVLTFLIERRTNVGGFGEEKWEWTEETVELELHEFIPDRLKDALK